MDCESGRDASRRKKQCPVAEGAAYTLSAVGFAVLKLPADSRRQVKVHLRVGSEDSILGI